MFYYQSYKKNHRHEYETEPLMSCFEMAIKHIADGTAYSWDLTVVLGHGITLPDSLRAQLLSGKTGPEEADYVAMLYARKQLRD